MSHDAHCPCASCRHERFAPGPALRHRRKRVRRVPGFGHVPIAGRRRVRDADAIADARRDPWYDRDSRIRPYRAVRKRRLRRERRARAIMRARS